MSDTSILNACLTMLLSMLNAAILIATNRIVAAIDRQTKAVYLDDDVTNALKECADDLEAEIKSRNSNDMLGYPTVRQKYDQDMIPVVKARTALRNAGAAAE